VHDSSDGRVTITETGTLVGDVRSRHISVLGQTAGMLDAAGGKVLLHASSSVSGKIRYSHLQVNGADLNAQLERVRPDGEGARRS
jgi:cytoskeletal protein CcmA (bactofilin family)